MKKILAAVAAVSFVAWAAPIAAAGFLDGLSEQLAPRFPDHSQEMISAAYRKFLWASFTGQLPDLDDLSDEEMDDLFRPYLMQAYLDKM